MRQRRNLLELPLRFQERERERERKLDFIISFVLVSSLILKPLYTVCVSRERDRELKRGGWGVKAGERRKREILSTTHVDTN